MKRFFSLILAPVLLLAGLLGAGGTPLGGSDRTPPANTATVFFENAWRTFKVACRQTVHELKLGVASLALGAHTWLRLHLFAPPLRLAAAATAERDTPYREGAIVTYPLAAATKIYLGTLVAVDASGNAKPAADTAGLRVVGRAEQTVDNTAGSAGDLTINVKRGVFKFTNSGTNAIDADDKDKFAYVEDDQTVAESTTNKIVAGRIIEVSTTDVWIDTTDKGPAAAAAATTVGAAVAATAATNTTPYGYSTAAQADDLVARVNQLRTDVIAIKDKLNGL